MNPESDPVDVTRLLESVEAGDTQAANQLFVLVHDELKQIAYSKMSSENPGVTLQATALVNEVWLRLIGDQNNIRFDSRGHFFVSAAQAMRQILVDAARSRQAIKRGGGLVRHDIETVQIANLPADGELIALDDALTEFEAIYPVKSQVVKLRYFSGMTIPEASATLGVSTATAERYWAFARAWLKNKLTGRESKDE